MWPHKQFRSAMNNMEYNKNTLCNIIRNLINYINWFDRLLAAWAVLDTRVCWVGSSSGWNRAEPASVWGCPRNAPLPWPVGVPVRQTRVLHSHMYSIACTTVGHSKFTYTNAAASLRHVTHALNCSHTHTHTQGHM